MATLKTGRGQHRKYLPFVFTEHGAIMAATILNSRRATEVAVYVVRAFVRLRELLSSSRELAKRLTLVEKKLALHDQVLADIVQTLRGLTEPEKGRRRPIGFVTSGE